MRQIVLDTETTGISAETGHRIIEIGCIELVNRKLTGRHFHTYLNPQRDVDEGAFRVHGISSEFLQDKILFEEMVEDFLEFVDGSELIIHNAPFDVGFIAAELRRISWSKTLHDYCKVFDTLSFARTKHPGQRNSLDALCKRYDIDNSNRQLHGALLDAEILAHVYLAMTGGQISLFIEEELSLSTPSSNTIITTHSEWLHTESPILFAEPEEISAHREFTDFLVKKSGIDHFSEESN